VKILRAYKAELRPNNAQRGMFLKCAGAARFVYNWALADRKAVYEAGGKPSMYEQKRRFNAVKAEQYSWLYEVPYALQEKAFANVDAAFQGFFRRVKNGEKPGYPRFKSRKRRVGSFTLRDSIHIEADRIKLTRIGWIRLKERGYLPLDGTCRLLSVCISERAGRWYASAQVEEEVTDPIPGDGPVVGVDLGIKTLAVCSDGATFENPRALATAERKLKRLNRELSRRRKGSKNRAKTRAKLARCHARIANIRSHALHNASYHLTAKTKPQAVVIEDLNVKGMLNNRSLSKAISDVGMGELRRQIEYKGTWYGVEVVTADRWYASSKTCSACGAVNRALTLSDRTYVCAACGAVIDRDLNAALNLASLAQVA
jgi:putative transposase